MKMPIRGRKDAWCLMGITSGIAAANPVLAGELAAGATLLASGVAGYSLTRPRVNRKYDRVDIKAKDDFVLPSDPLPEVGDDSFHMGYTTDTNSPVKLPYDLAMRHFGLIGASGVGKTTLGMYMIWQHMTKGGGFLFIDAKIDADTRDALYYMAKVCGRQDEFYILNPDDPENSNTYNPILEGDADEVASRLLNLQPSSEDNPGADYYRQSANHALTVIVAAMKKCQKRYTFADLAILLQSGDAMEKLLKDTPNSPERMALDIFLDKYRRKDPKVGAILDINKMKDVLGGMAGRIALFAQGKFGQVFNTYTPEINLTDIIKNNRMMYCMLPTMGKDAAALNLGKMIMSDIRTAVYNIQNLQKAMRPWPPFLIFPDEMGSYVMEGIARLFEQARSAQVCLMPGFQAFGNLKAVSDQFADIIIQNTWSKVYYRFGSQDSAEMASEMMGKSVRYIRSISKGETEGESAQFLRAAPQSSKSDGGSKSESWREDEINRVTPDHLRSLGIGQAVVTIGAKVYHIKVPRLTTPLDKEEKGEPRHPDLIARPVRFPVKMPPGESGLDFANRYETFMMAGEANNAGSQGKDGAPEKSDKAKKPSSKSTKAA